MPLSLPALPFKLYLSSYFGGGRMKLGLYTTKEFFVRARNVPGLLYKMSSLLGEHGVNVESISAFAVNDDEAIFRIVSNDIETTAKLLSRMDNVLEADVGDVLVVKLENKPGELAKAAERLHKRGVDLEAVYILKTGPTTEVALKPKNMEAAIAALKG